MFEFVMNEPTEHEESLLELYKLEIDYNIVFPEVLAYFYTKYDGAKIRLTQIKVEKLGGYEVEVNKFIPLVSEGITIRKVKEEELKDGFIKETLIPLASDRGGNYFYWDSDDKAVYYVPVDDCDEPYKISDNVEEFFTLISGNRLSYEERNARMEFLHKTYNSLDEEIKELQDITDDYIFSIKCMKNVVSRLIEYVTR